MPSKGKRKKQQLRASANSNSLCTVIPYNISIEEWTSGKVFLPQVNFDISHLNLPLDIYARAGVITKQCKQSKALAPIFCGGEFSNIFIVELGRYVCLSAITSSFKIQANQLLNMITEEGKNPFGNSIILRIQQTSHSLHYLCVPREEAMAFLEKQLEEKARQCLERDLLIRDRYWLYDPDCSEGTALFGDESTIDTIENWGYNTALMANHYKVHRCCRVRAHSKKNCPFYHSLADARRPLSMFKYAAKRCSRGAEDCYNGAKCSLSHNEFEYYYHPDFLRHSDCMYFKQNRTCKGALCSFFHQGEMDPPIKKEKGTPLPQTMFGIKPVPNEPNNSPKHRGSPLSQSLNQTRKAQLMTSFSQEGIIYSIRQSSDRTLEGRGGDDEFLPPGVSQPGREFISIQDSTLHCPILFPDSALRKTYEPGDEQTNISLEYQYQVQCLVILVSFTIRVLQEFFGLDNWNVKLNEFFLSSPDPNFAASMDPSVWKINIIREIIKNMKHEDKLIFTHPTTATNALYDFFCSPIPLDEEGQFHLFCYLIQIIKMESYYFNYTSVCSMACQFEELFESQGENTGENLLEMEYSIEFWELFAQYLWRDPLQFSPDNNETFHILINTGSLPSFDHTAGALYISNVNWDMVLDFDISESSIPFKTLFHSISQNKKNSSVYFGTLNDFPAQSYDVNELISWFSLSSKEQTSLLPEEYSRTVIGGNQDLLLLNYLNQLSKKRIHCTVLAYDEEIENNPLIVSHVNHILNLLYRIPTRNVTFSCFSNRPKTIRSLLLESALRRSITPISFAKVCNGFQTVVDKSTLPVLLPTTNPNQSTVSLGHLYRRICPFFQLLFLSADQYCVKSLPVSKLNWAKGSPVSWKLLESEYFPLSKQRNQFITARNELLQACQMANSSKSPVELSFLAESNFEGATLARQLLWDIHKEYPCLVTLFTEDLSYSDANTPASIIADVYKLTQNVVVVLVDSEICSVEKVVEIITGNPFTTNIPVVVLTIETIHNTSRSKRVQISPIIAEEEAKNIKEFLIQVVKENDKDSDFTLAKIDHQVAILERYYNFQPTLFAYTVLFRLQKGSNIEQFVFEQLAAARLDQKRMLLIMSIAFSFRFAEEPMPLNCLLIEGFSLTELISLISSEPIKKMLFLDNETRTVTVLNIYVANEIIKWICNSLDIKIAGMVTLFIETFVRGIDCSSPLWNIILKIFYRIEHEDKFTELISSLSQDKALVILQYLDQIMCCTYTACGLARFLWTYGDQNDETTEEISALMESALARCSTSCEQFYYFLHRGMMFNTMFDYHIQCSNLSNKTQILPLVDTLHKRACSNYFKARGRLFGPTLDYTSDYLIFPWILELSIRTKFLKYFLSCIAGDSSSQQNQNFLMTNYLLGTNDLPSSLEDSRSICIELFHKLELFASFKNDPNLLRRYRLKRDWSLIRTSLDRIGILKATLIPLLGENQAHYVSLQALCNTENKFSYEARRMCIWNLVENLQSNNLSSWYNPSHYIQQSIEYILRNVRPKEDTRSFRDFDMTSWVILSCSQNENNIEELRRLSTSWCFHTGKCANNHPVIANFYRSIILFIDFLENPDSSRKEIFSTSQQTCVDLCTSYDYPYEVANTCLAVLNSSRSIEHLTSTRTLYSIDASSLLQIKGVLYIPEGTKTLPYVVFHDVKIPVKDIQSVNSFSVSGEDRKLDVSFSVAFSWNSPYAININQL